MANNREELSADGVTIFRNLFDKPFIDKMRVYLAQHATEQIANFATIAMFTRPEYAELYTHPLIRRVLKEDLGCADPKYWSAYLINKNPGEPRRLWHQDWYAWDEPQSRDAIGPQLGLMVYFTPTNEFNGCLEVVRGSHRKWWVDDFKTSADWTNKHPRGENVIVNPGDLVVTDARTLHATAANISQDQRIMCTLWYFTNWQSMSPEFRAFRALREDYWAVLGDLWPQSDRPPNTNYLMQLMPARDELL